MIMQELLDVLKSASVSELAQVRSLLRIPDVAYGIYKENEMPKNLGEIWNRTEQRVECKSEPR